MKRSDLAAFFAAEQKKLVGYVRSLLRETAEMDAEDIVQDVLVNLLERADLSLPLEHLAAYVYRSLKNRFIDVLRRKKKLVPLDDRQVIDDVLSLDQQPAVESKGYRNLDGRESTERLVGALERLSEIERRVIVANEFEGIPFRELARRWQMPLNTLLSHKYRAMKKMKSYVQNERSQGE